MAPSTCRLCDATTTQQFRFKVLDKYDIDLVRCDRCESLQTDPVPFWLEEAYADGRRFFDTGSVLRNQTLQMYASYLRWAFRFGPEATALDWGGDNGLFVRMLRDIGFDAYHFDKYATNTYAPGFDDTPGREYDLITAFEVYEHFPEPAASLEAIFARRPQVHFITTSLYHGQGPQWEYLAPHAGRHVFFFSAKALDLIARRYGYALISMGLYHLFYRIPLTDWHRRVLIRLLSGQNQRFFRTLFAARSQGHRVRSDKVLMMERAGIRSLPLES